MSTLYQQLRPKVPLSLLREDEIVQKSLNYEKYRDLENELNQQSLVDFITHMGERYRSELNSNLANLKNERLELQDIVYDIEGAVQQKQAKLTQVQKQRKLDEDRVQRLRKANETLKAKIADKNALLGDKQPLYNKLLELAETSKREITADNLKKVYQFLEKKSAEPVAFVMEALVGLMRGMKRADTKSVELYIKKHEGFMIGLNRLNLKKVNFQNCTEHLHSLRDRYNAMLNSEEFAIFGPYRKLLAELCQAGLVAQDIAHIEENIAKKEAEIHTNVRDIEKTEMLLKTVDVEGLIREDCETYLRLQVFRTRLDYIDQEIAKIQARLANFDKDFLESGSIY